MASMMGGDFVVANVLKNAYKEKVRRLEEAEARNRNGAAGSGSAPAAGENKEAGGSGRGGGLFGLMKKKVHPRAAGSAMEASGAFLLDSAIYPPVADGSLLAM
jgi:hypothetical protein